MASRINHHQPNEFSGCPPHLSHFRSISGQSSISDFAKPEIGNTGSLDDWNYPSEVDFEGLSDVDVPHSALPVNKRAPPQPRIRNRAKASAAGPPASLPTATGSGIVAVPHSSLTSIRGPLTSGVDSSGRRRRPPTSRVVGPSSSSTRKRHGARRSSKRSPPDSTDDASFINSASPPPAPSSSDSDDLVLHRHQLRPRPLEPIIPFGSAPAALDQSGMAQSATTPLSNATSRQLDDAIAVTAAQSTRKQAAALDSLLSAPPATDISAHPAWLTELDARRQSTQRFLQAHPSRTLPWHMAIVLANSTVAPQMVQQIQRHRVHWSPSSSPPASPVSEPAPQMQSPNQKSSPVSAFPDVVSTSRRASSPDVVPADEL